MNKRQKARLALQILNDSGQSHSFQHLSDAEIDSNADELIALVSNNLIDQGANLLTELMRLGYSNKVIAEKTGYDESTLVKLRKKSDELQIALSTLRDLVSALTTVLARFKVTRMSQALSSSSIVAVGFCSLDKTVTEGERRAATRAVVTNITRSLSGHAGQRMPLPPNIGGVLLRIGPWENGLRVYQSEGVNNAEVLEHEIHELEELLEHMKDDLARMTRKPPTQRPRSAF